jgi:hypothetical protein
MNTANQLCRSARPARYWCAAACAVLLALVAGVGTAAPVPKDAGKPDPTPDLKAAFEVAARAVKAEKWPGEGDEKVLKNTARVVFERALKAADQKPRPLPVDYDTLMKLDVTAEHAKPLNGHYLIAGKVLRGTARNSVIFASGPVQLTTVENCVIVAPSVRVSTAYNCVIVAGDHLRLVSSRRREGGEGSVLVAGQWIRASTLDGAVCHVIRPGTDPAPDDPKGAANARYFAIQTNRAAGSIFLNAQDAARITLEKDETFLTPKFPLTK